MAITLRSPHKFKERILLFGGAGAGKTNAVLQIASHVPGEFWIYDNDYSFAYNRALSSEFTDLDDTGRIHVHEASDTTWTSCIDTVEKMVKAADEDTDWLVIDSITPTWGWVQNWFQETVYGQDLAAHLVELKKTHADDAKAYGRAVLEDMNWPLVKKEYQRLYRIIQQWKGHLIITAEAKQVGRGADDNDRMLYGHLGFKPSGEGSLHHMASTNLFLSHPDRNRWVVDTVKDRNREELEKVEVDNFAMDYLKGVAGWKVKKKQTAEAGEGEGE